MQCSFKPGNRCMWNTRLAESALAEQYAFLMFCLKESTDNTRTCSLKKIICLPLPPQGAITLNILFRAEPENNLRIYTLYSY